ncbi:cation channel sperm-associated protein subunit beta protein family-domain-containing protein [Polychytrium aggregatum]|uniref:cation channel sperm-associated protein subunit beta protein family-domain-containing protein n=1 Tax=Polychytrium aggregatum TaxID=110093 RepID=UPI0022FE6D57|nr:cation channel sperm-associated protein subunit beta protein family-domain-containing protein [Polychytrium aggregatum]KAI9206844.1 cation channel sperm-associated protein subunit beta protein family-domain-containing protein [Polychytrium aggregatum]
MAWQLFGSSDCWSGSPSYIFVGYLQGSGFANAVAYSTPLLARNASWFKVSLLSMDASITTSFALIGCLRDAITRQNIYLVGVPTAGSSNCGVVSCTYQQARIIFHSTTVASPTSTFSLGFVFPSSEIVTGIAMHSNSQELFVMGSQLWRSSDGGNLFTAQYQLNSGEYFSGFQSENTFGGYVIETTAMGLYYGKDYSLGIARLASVSLNPASMSSAILNKAGGLNYVRLETVPSYSSNQSLYPQGFLKDSSGTLRSYPDSFVKRWTIPLQSLLGATDMSFGSALVPVMQQDGRLSFYAASTATSSTVFLPSHIGGLIGLASGGVVFIDGIDSSGRIAFGIIRTPLASDSASIAPALSSSLGISGATTTSSILAALIQPTAVTFNVTLTLISPPTGSVWLYSDIGKTVIANSASILITGIVNSTMASGELYFGLTSSAVASPGTWGIYDFRSANNVALTQSQTLGVSSVANSTLVGLRLSAGFMSFQYTDVGSVIYTSDGGQAQIMYLLDSLNAAVAPIQPFAQATYSPGTWNIVRPLPGNLIQGIASSTSNQARSWTLYLDECGWTRMPNQDTSLSSVHYLSYGANISYAIGIQFSSGSEIAALGWNVHQSTLRSLNTTDYMIGQTINTQWLQNNVTVEIVDTGIVHDISTQWKIPKSSIRCQESLGSQKFRSGCSPQRYLTPSTLPMAEYLSDSAILLLDLPLMQALPYNYRPPSSQGDSIPTSSNIYNAAPERPRYNDRYEISKSTGVYKQCAGKPNRQACGCTDEERVSMMVMYSDCIDRAVNVFYDTAFLPQLFIKDNPGGTAPLQSQYKLVELNNRTDFCAPSSLCANPQQVIMDPTNNDSIVWQGSQLFHFRATVIGTEYCNLSAEFMVYVVEPSNTINQIATGMAVTGVVFCVLLFACYLYYSYKQSVAW